MIPLLLLLLACPSNEPTAPQAPSAEQVASLAEQVAAVQSGLQAAQTKVAAGDRAAAGEAVRRTYVAHFQPVAEVLRVHDPSGALALEVAFGEAQRQAASRGGSPDLIALGQRVADAVAALPPPPTPAAP